MPFDTTYIVTTGDEKFSGTIVLKGGADTTITLAPWQLPSDLDPVLAANDSVIHSLQLKLAEDMQNADPYMPSNSFIFVFIGIFVIIFLKARQNIRAGVPATAMFYNAQKAKGQLSHRYRGADLRFTNTQLQEILTRRFSYFNTLQPDKQLVFIERLKQFITGKVFTIHGDKKFKEMPVLISAAAIQLSFGLKNYLLPYFKFIHIYPQEFMRVNPGICFLEGNVSGHTINLSWKHFLDGYATPDDGQNVGLHELGHAFYYQAFEAGGKSDGNFRNYYDSFNTHGNKAFHSEKNIPGSGLYSAYAEKNFQEFWAESVELFFERPADMRSHYPDLFETMKGLLNQDPLAPGPSPFT
jgi:MtfA peptidase